ncbi:MAG TPA: hypothetical protein PLU53_07435 [Bacteroidia bacterium]|nr:hypothetical protein [Bacteroidia bacterium]
MKKNNLSIHCHKFLYLPIALTYFHAPLQADGGRQECLTSVEENDNYFLFSTWTAAMILFVISHFLRGNFHL